MLRELFDAAVLEDFVSGFARSCGMRVLAYDARGALIAASPPASRAARLSGHTPQHLPRRLEFAPLAADAPPASVAHFQAASLWYLAAPIHVGEVVAGCVAVGEMRAAGPAPPPPGPGVSADAWRQAYGELPLCDHGPDSPELHAVRWAARMLAQWCRREAQLDATTAELALVGDVGTLLSGEHSLQTILDGIVAETARVMKCPYASLRLYDPKTEQLLIAAAYNMSVDYTHVPRISRKDNPIDDEALRGRTVYIENAQEDPRFRFREEARRMGLVSGLTTGMLYQGKPVGVLRIYSNRRQRFRSGQRHLLRAVAAQAAIAIVNARLLEDRLRAAAMERQLAMAGQVQERMVRSAPLAHAGVQTAIVFEPSSHVGGDFCDVFALGDGGLLAAVGDVSGHGLPAALLMASVRGALRATATRVEDLARLMGRINEHVLRETSSSEFVSLLLAAVDADGRRLTVCNAGHEPPLLLREGRIKRHEPAGLVLGVENEPYDAQVLELLPDDFLLLCTDGVVEAMNFNGELFGRDRLSEALIRYGAQPPEPALRNIRWDVRRFVGLAEQSDDLTMVGLRVRGGT